MAILEQIMNMKRQGIPDQQIVNELTQRGVSPKEINDALGQAQIKNAVSDYGDEMQPSMMSNPEESYVPAPAPSATQQQEYQPEQYAPAPQQETYAPQEQEQQYYAPGTGTDYTSAGIEVDTIMEIADQLFSEKIKKVQKQVDKNSEAVTLLQTKTENISDRLKKIETIIDKLQIAILEKVGSYGKNLESIKKEMSMMQDSFSKMVSHPKTKKKK
jgi:hypothetical protein